MENIDIRIKKAREEFDRIQRRMKTEFIIAASFFGISFIVLLILLIKAR